MSSFVPDHFSEYRSPLGEGPSHLECPRNPGQTNLVISEMPQVVNNQLNALQVLGEEPSHPEQHQGPGETHITGVQQVIITIIRAADLTLGLRRVPAGFHVVVKTDGAEFQTSNKPIHVDQAVVEWNELILLPCEPSSKIRVSVYASFELGPMLCHGEVLRTFEITVQELLDYSEKSRSIIFQPKQGEVVSPCTSLFMTVEQRLSDQNDTAVPNCPLTTVTSCDMDALALKTDAGHRLLARYRRTQNSRDLDQSMKHFERASDLCPMDHPCRPAALFNLAIVKFVGCQANETYPDLDIPISVFQDALDLRPTGHPDRPVTQLHLAISLLSRFVKRGFQTDADTAEELLSEVLDVCDANSHIYRAALFAIETCALHPAGSIGANDLGQEQPAASMLPLSLNQLARRTRRCLRIDDPHALDEVISLYYDALGYYNSTHHDRAHLLCNLGAMLLTRVERRGNDEDLDRAITIQREALVLRPVGHTHRPSSLNNIANGLSIRFHQRGHVEDLDEAIALNREVLALHTVGHPDRSMSLNNLSVQLVICFDHRGNVEDLDEAIVLQREALALRPVGHEDRSMSLNNLSGQLSICFNHRGNVEDLDEAIALQREALALRLVGHKDRSRSLNNLGNQLSTRFHRRGRVEDLDEAIALQREALALFPVSHPDRPSVLNNLAGQLSSRFDHRGNHEDLDEALALNREALALCPVGHTHWFSSLNHLATQLSIRFRHRGHAEDLDEAIALDREALALCPVGHTGRFKSLNNLGGELSTRFVHRGNAEDLDEAIALHREALASCPVGHTNRPLLLNRLGEQLSTHFDRQGNAEDLDEAIALHREALASCPVGHTYRPLSLNRLGEQLSTRFNRQGNDEDLDEAIALQMEALDLHPVGHTHRSLSLNALAGELSTRFHRRGNGEDLDEAIALLRETLGLHPVGHTHRSSVLNNLALELSTRFHHQGNGEDVDEGIALLREALDLHPVGHIDRSSSLNSLANQLSTRFDSRGNNEDLDEAIALQREALALCPVGHKYRSKLLDSLADQLSTRFHHRGNGEDLDEAIALDGEALSLRPVGHPDRPSSLNGLGGRLSTRFDYRGNTEDLNESRENLRCALTLLPEHDPRRFNVHQSLSTVYLLFHGSELHCTGAREDTDSLNAAMYHLKAAANAVPAGLLFRLRAGVRWARLASQHSHDTQLEAFATSMQLMDAYMSTTASVSSRHDAMKDFPSMLAVDAASCALRSGDVRRAVELLEQGRTVIWTQMTRLRTPLDSLQTRGDHAVALMKKFRDLSSLLDKPPASHREGSPRIAVEAQATQYRRLVEDWNRAVEEIRKIEGFSRFLLPPLFSDLQDAARGGPIIVLIASDSSCDAIIISHKQPPTSIQLPTDFEKLVTLVIKFQRTGSPGLIQALVELWDDVVRPVVENLGGFARPGSRIWWCPTSVFNFLPLHAAGAYRPGERLLSELYISSYTPSLTALMKARTNHDRALSVPFAAIGQNHPAGGSFLNNVEPELELVQSLLSPHPTVSFTKITSVDATKSRALHALRDNTWLHFACHGTQNHGEPFNSAFLMRDQPLSLLDITQMDLSRHQFAFLSACETAVGTFRTPDEAIHLAAGLQFAGVKSVVGTLWEVNDDTVQRLVKAFYKNLCEDGKMNSKGAARALHRAVWSLKDIPLDQRIVFIHIGI